MGGIKLSRTACSLCVQTVPVSSEEKVYKADSPQELRWEAGALVLWMPRCGVRVSAPVFDKVEFRLLWFNGSRGWGKEKRASK